MTDLDTSIRQGLGCLVDATPIPPTFHQIKQKEITTGVRRRHRRGLKLGAGALVVVSLVAVPAVAWEVGNPFARSYQPGDELAAHYGFVVPNADVGKEQVVTSLTGVKLGVEIARPHGVQVSPGDYLPTGPLGPLYAQIGDVPSTVSRSNPFAVTGVDVMTLQPGEVDATARNASGARDSIPVRFAGHTAQLWKPWSAEDSTVLSWRPTSSVGVLLLFGPAVSSTPLSMKEMERLATEVHPLKRVPVLARNDMTPEGGTTSGYWSLGQAATDRPGAFTSTWFSLAVLFGGPSSLPDALSNVVARGSLDGQHWTVRDVGDPVTGNLTLGGFGWREENGIAQPVAQSGLAAESTGSGSLRLIEGSAPDDVRSVRIILSNGSSITAPTVDIGRGWNDRLFGTAVITQSSNVLSIEGITATGHVAIVAHGDLPLHGNVAAEMATKP